MNMNEELKELTGLYSLSKTLRFELKPEPETKQQFEKWIEELQDVTDFNEAIKSGNFFAKDKAIYKSYLALKPILDSIHEQFITLALQSDEAKNIDFSSYFEKYSNKEKLDDEENKLRAEIGKLYLIPAKRFEVINKRGKTNLKEKAPYEVLTDKLILSHIEQNISFYAENISEAELRNHLEVFSGFFTYFYGYNTNRENYYETDKEKATAVATRIVHENLPSFCNNVIRYEANKDLYNDIYSELKKAGRETKLKTENGEKEAEPINEQIFKITHFSNCLSQAQIDAYNGVIANANLLINLYNQLHSKENGFKRIQLFETLYKQIGCGKRESLFLQLLKDSEDELTDEQKNSGEILSLEKMLSVVAEKATEFFIKSDKNVGISTIPNFLEYLENCNDWKGVYWNKTAVTSISNRFFTNWHDIADKLKENPACASFNKNQEEQIKLNDAVELDGLFSVLDEEKAENAFKKTVLDEYKNIIDLSEPTSRNLIRILCFNAGKSISLVLENKEKVLSAKRNRKKSENEEDTFVSLIKDWFDSIIDVMHFIRNFDVRESKIKGSILNSEIKEAVNLFLHSDDTPWFKWYDLARNYLTKKPQDDVKDNKLKLNFGKANLLDGFTDSHSDSDNATQYGGYLFRKYDSFSSEYEYFLGLSKNSKLFRCHLKDTVSKEDMSEYERLEYYQMKPSTPYPSNYNELKKDLVEFIEDKINVYIKKYPEEISNLTKINKKIQADNPTPTVVINEIEKSDSLKSILEDKDLVEKINMVISLIQENCKKFIRVPELCQLAQKKYNGISGLKEILADISQTTKECKIIEFFHISKEEFNQHNGKDLFLLQISNKDLSYCRTFRENKRKRKNENKENLHTMIFRALMREYKNCLNIDLGKGEVFLREPAYHYSDEVLKKGHHYEELKDKFDYPIISNKRFSERKFLFHLSVALNYASKNYALKDYDKARVEVNAKVNDTLQKSENITYLGIDRGEKHLIYTCVVDKDGKILECKSQNKIEGTDYNQKLSEVAENRQEARKNWQTIGNISNLKEGYISNVVHNIVSQAIEKPTYIILEDLNTGMKRGRQKVEKQVYQKFEVALAKKLNFVVDKSAKENELASVGMALQLTPPIANYQDIENKKQFGVMLYTRANYTSITDSLTGWRKTIYLRKGSEEFIKKQILENFTEIGFDGKDYFFEYTEKHAGKTWRLYSGKDGVSLPRFQNNRKLENDKAIWQPEAVDLVPILNELFAGFNKDKSLREQLLNNEHQLCKIASRKETAWDSLRYVIDTIQHIRNTGKTEEDSNFLYSPVRDENGIHFDTRKYHNTDLPADADANGAYNIARKGIIMDAHIKQWIKDGKKEKDLDLFVSDEEWDLWLLDKEKWNAKLSVFASRSAKEKRK